jgi:hypothetical protein
VWLVPFQGARRGDCDKRARTAPDNGVYGGWPAVPLVGQGVKPPQALVNKRTDGQSGEVWLVAGNL